MSLGDFASAEASWVEPVSAEFHGAEIVEIPPASQGITALIGLNILEQLDIGAHAPESGERRHLEIEALRLAWTFRNRHIADPDFAPHAGHGHAEHRYGAPARPAHLARPRASWPGGCASRQRHGLSQRRRSQPPRRLLHQLALPSLRIGNRRTENRHRAAEPRRGLRDRSRPSQLHRTRKAATAHPHAGHVPQERQGKPVLRSDGRVLSADGSHRGARQSPRLWHGQPGSARFRTLLSGRKGSPSSSTACLRQPPMGSRARGHRVVRSEGPLGGGQIVEIDWARGTLIGASDPRKDGLALGY